MRLEASASAPINPAPPALTTESLDWTCPHCRSDLEVREDARPVRCSGCGNAYGCQQGIWDFLPAPRREYFSQFLREYETIREAEGRFGDAQFYRALPFLNRSQNHRGPWSIRASSFHCLMRRIIRPLERGMRLRIVDLGAGNGWLSHRLSARGHSLVAVDLSSGHGDGLGCLRYYETRILAVRAEFDSLPWGESQFDLAIFNASLHYSCCYEETLSEALRVLKPGGRLVVMDTPVYHDAGSGALMVRQRQEEFTRRFGFPSDALPMENFLSFRRLERLGRILGVRWELHWPKYGWRWALRPWKAWLAGHREPARFLLIVAQKDSDP